MNIQASICASLLWCEAASVPCLYHEIRFTHAGYEQPTISSMGSLMADLQCSLSTLSTSTWFQAKAVLLTSPTVSLSTESPKKSIETGRICSARVWGLGTLVTIFVFQCLNAYMPCIHIWIFWHYIHLVSACFDISSSFTMLLSFYCHPFSASSLIYCAPFAQIQKYKRCDLLRISEVRKIFTPSVPLPSCGFPK